jgi:hypothetical protein
VETGASATLRYADILETEWIKPTAQRKQQVVRARLAGGGGRWPTAGGLADGRRLGGLADGRRQSRCGGL